MDNNYFLIAKQIAEYLSQKEGIEHLPDLQEWRKLPENERLIRKIEGEARQRAEEGRYDDFSCQEGWEHLQVKCRHLRRRRMYYRIVVCAAGIAIFLGIGLYWRMQSGEITNETVSIVAQDIGPGGPKARLILDNGTEIDLMQQQGVIGDSLAFIRNAGHCLTYKADTLAVRYAPVYHELVIPACGEYQLQLCDGTVVYLNAMTRLRFPNLFEEGVREVELEGEAYFKVAKDPERPFVVKSAHSVVYVYGTEFNVSAYPDETGTHTTLVEGKLAVENSGIRREIRPGEQWYYHKESGSVTVRHVDVSLYIAWKDGGLRFNDARLEEIMQTVSRWYGVEISYQSEDLKDLRFGCNFNRHASIEPLLRVFEANGKIRVERDGNRIKIKRGR